MAIDFDHEPSELRQVLGRLNEIPRTGWRNSGVPVADCETVGEHTSRVLKLVAELAPNRTGVEVERALDMARCHDYAEAITGDHVPGDITPKQKRSDEDEAYAQFCSQHFARGSVIRDLCIEYRNDKTPNARLVKDVDKFQRLDQANIYREKFPNLNFKRFQPDANLIRDPELKEKADDIVRTWRSADLQHVKCVFVVGPPGVGKGTQCARAVHLHENMKHVSAGELLRSARNDNKSPYHKEAESVLGGLTPASAKLITALLYEAVTSGDFCAVLIDGFPYDSAQLAGYKEFFPNVSGVIDLVASASICKKRLLGRAQRSERDDDAESKLDKRLEGYGSRGKAIARQLKEENQNTYHEINADQDEDAVALDFQKALHYILPSEVPAPRGMTEDQEKLAVMSQQP